MPVTNEQEAERRLDQAEHRACDIVRAQTLWAAALDLLDDATIAKLLEATETPELCRARITWLREAVAASPYNAAL